MQTMTHQLCSMEVNPSFFGLVATSDKKKRFTSEGKEQIRLNTLKPW